ncbi:hypothetical protein CKN99_04060 [Carnobacterium maltaromaticum]|uniref:restriction endonuclease subunit S n=1 Tax=Carnobacterium maltaromaticum TaxID=2751 RepID=UPI000705650F|nr:restriction endonuclease subunit S [Carnobacterium maltaromaticum]KRN84684.1 hypothetical protein IV75_GL000215 [Carnobacterium maltaromaticum]MDT1945913.1 restriction endonuclease subunit S [Carnobacterium maltaromaticum]MDT2000417.1 restriction endonuclease subunit S [Carnobacterium maltaromaticum]TFJ30269.1 hypothetical protein CKN90_04055 [Carnobacterium maltaromaticum]TFJ33729.1 hypothetical protein CKN98_04060 [Carnobacterium maltaromaticum]
METTLGNIIHFESGLLISRIENEEKGKEYFIYENDQFYNNDSFLNERKSIRTSKSIQKISVNEIIINLYKGECTKVREEYSDYIINANFAKGSLLDEKIIDKNYFIYWFNESEESKKQLLQDIQGSVMKKISISKLKELRITLPDIEAQTIIGNLYQAQMELNDLYEKNYKLKKIRTIEKIRMFEKKRVEKEGE